MLCAGKMAAIFPIFDAQIDSVAATMSVFVGATIPESLMAHCQENCHGVLRLSFDIVYAYFFTWCLFESGFWFYMMYMVRWHESNHFEAVKSHDAGTTKGNSDEEDKLYFRERDERQRHFNEVAKLEFRSKERGREYVRKWFLGAKSYSDVHEDNLKEFYAFAYFQKSSVRHLDSRENTEMLAFLKSTKSHLGGLSHGRNENIRSIRPMFDPLLAEHHPLSFYFFTEGLVQVLYCFFRLSSLGFKSHSAGKVRYWFHPGPTTRRKQGRRGNAGAMPVILFPGVGVGLISYEKIFKSISKERPVIVFEMPCVSLRIVRGFVHYTKDDILQAIATIRDNHVEFASPQEIHFVGHSFGSGVVSWIIKYFEPKIEIGNVTLMDAMPFCLHLSGLPRNFMYDPFEDGRVYLVNREPHLAYTLMRKLNWPSLILWPEDLTVLKNPATVILSGNDSLIPSVNIKGQLAEAGHDGVAETNLIWLSDCDHGDFLFDNALAKTVTKHILNPMRKGKSFGMHYTLVTRGEMRKKFVKHKRRRKALGLL